MQHSSSWSLLWNSRSKTMRLQTYWYKNENVQHARNAIYVACDHFTFIPSSNNRSVAVDGNAAGFLPPSNGCYKLRCYKYRARRAHDPGDARIIEPTSVIPFSDYNSTMYFNIFHAVCNGIGRQCC